MNTPYTYKGLVGVKAIAEAYNLNPKTLYGRLQRGQSIEDAVNPRKVRHNTRPNAVAIRFPDLMSASWRLALGIAR